MIKINKQDCPGILSDNKESWTKELLDERLNKWKFEKNINYNFLINPTCKISTLPAISDENGNIDESSEVAKLCLKYYDLFIEEEHIRKGGGAQFGYGRAGLSLVFQSICPNNSLYLLWHSYNDRYTLFPRVSHHR